MPYQYMSTPALPYISLAYGLTAVALLMFITHLGLQRHKLRQLHAALRAQGEVKNA